MLEIVGVDESPLLLVHSRSVYSIPLLNFELCISLSQNELPKQAVSHRRHSVHDHILAHLNNQ